MCSHCNMYDACVPIITRITLCSHCNTYDACVPIITRITLCFHCNTYDACVFIITLRRPCSHCNTYYARVLSLISSNAFRCRFPSERRLCVISIVAGSGRALDVVVAASNGGDTRRLPVMSMQRERSRHFIVRRSN